MKTSPSRSLLALALWAAAFLLTSAAAAAAEPAVLHLEGDVEGVHDPSIIKDKDTYYVFCTGGGARGNPGIIPIRTSKDLIHWTSAGMALPDLPEWAKQEIPGARGAWAPDISFFAGQYHLYYAVSTFGSRNSAIGLATNRTLDPKDPEYKWVDQGMVLRSYQDKDDWNAIDPNIVVEDAGHVWLNWGSFWSGIKMRRIDAATGKLSTEDTKMYALGTRDRAQPVGESVEAPFIVNHGGFWYLFASYDRCCRGAQSTYNVVVGRSKDITGPYVDKDGKPMLEGGGSKVIEATTPNWRGPGHEAVLRDPGQDYLIFHAYQGTNGNSYLQISTMAWEDDWPRVGTLP